MPGRSHIEWTECTWNPVTGCTKTSLGCQNCYAARMARRLKAMGHARYSNGFAVTLHEDVVELPLRWKKPQTVFVNSMSDLFHPQVPLDFIRRVFEVMAAAQQHRFQILTKRAARLAAVASKLEWPPNVWMGVTVEAAAYVSRVEQLLEVPAAVRFLSLEPLLDAVEDLPLAGIDWVIVGGESGPGARLMQPGWVRRIRDECLAAEVAFFFKQWGGVRRTEAGRHLDGRLWSQMPAGNG